MAVLTQSPITGGILTGERASQPLHQSLSSVFGFDSWYDTHCCPPPDGWSPFSASIRGDTHQLGPPRIMRFSRIKADLDQGLQCGDGEDNETFGRGGKLCCGALITA